MNLAWQVSGLIESWKDVEERWRILEEKLG